MEKGKETCNELKRIRKQIADDNDIVYETCECQHQGECSGTCPKCESETRYIENQLALRQKAGKVIRIMGVATTMTLMTACNPFGGHQLEGSVPNYRAERENTDTTNNSNEKSETRNNDNQAPLKEDKKEGENE